MNALGGVWLGDDVLARGATRFSGEAAACSALGISFAGDAFTTTDPAAVARARQLPRVMLLNRRHGPGQLAVFVQRAPHLDGASLMTFAVSDDQRSIEAMTHALLPARDADEARTRLLAAIDGARAAPEWDAAEHVLHRHFGVPLPSVGGAASRAAGAPADAYRRFRRLLVRVRRQRPHRPAARWLLGHAPHRPRRRARSHPPIPTPPLGAYRKRVSPRGSSAASLPASGRPWLFACCPPRCEQTRWPGSRPHCDRTFLPHGH